MTLLAAPIRVELVLDVNTDRIFYAIFTKDARAPHKPLILHGKCDRAEWVPEAAVYLTPCVARCRCKIFRLPAGWRVEVETAIKEGYEPDVRKPLPTAIPGVVTLRIGRQ